MQTEPKSSGEVLSLTGLRGIAALFVVLFHALRSSSPATEFILGKGYLSVDLFFVLSGYVMALNYGRLFSAERTPLRNYARFLALRLARTYPLYLVVICLCAALGRVGAMPLYSVHHLGAAFAWNIALLQAWSFGAGNIDQAAWSISTEWAAYLIFPMLIGLAFAGSERRAWVAAGSAVLVLTAICVIGLFPIPGGPTDGPLNVFETATPLPVLRCLAGFVLGLAARRLQDGATGRTLSARPVHGDLIAIALVALLLVPAGDVVFVAVVPLLIMHLAASPSCIASFLGSRLVYYFGAISYSIYLVHIPIIFVLREIFAAHGWPALSANLVAVVLTLAVAPLAYHLIEVPGRRAVRRMLAAPKVATV